MSVNMGGEPGIGASPQRWDFLAGLMLQLGMSSFVEVGCGDGRTTAHILTALPEATAITVDPWKPFATQDLIGRYEAAPKWDFAKLEADYYDNIRPVADRCVHMRKTSAEAALDLADAANQPEFDLVFLDGAQDYDSVLHDIRLWFPLVRDGGILAGGGFNHRRVGLQRAIADSFNLMTVGIGPDSVWFVVSTEGAHVRADKD